MTLPVIKVEQLSKKFILAHENKAQYTSFRDAVTGSIQRTFSRSKKRENSTSVEEFYALRDVSFEIFPGDRVGIIGRNGAGKSTLLKILSRITEPTCGRIGIRGRVASLLEVGTGFHPELTGRENIFLNGAILGMSRSEIRRKFDEIVDFAEIERFLDTPVKRYSSGMYVRLAFAVAAHLEPEILIVDEVLAVGDAQFQKKCLGKMEDVSKNQGRTVLFVSHNMGVMAQLCKSAILLNKGSLAFAGNIGEVIESYVRQNNQNSLAYLAGEDNCRKDIFIKSVQLENKSGEISENFLVNENIYIKLVVGVNQYNSQACISITLQNMLGDYLSTFVETIRPAVNGEVALTIKLPANVIAPNTYAFRFATFIPNGAIFDLVDLACPIRVIDSGSKMALFDGVNYGSFIMNYEIV